MAKKYEKRESSGREYVDDTKAFVDYTMFSVAKLPRRWEHILINPMIDITDKIETIVYEANRIYIDPNKQPPAELYAAYTSRISCLSEALRCFSAFDRKIDRMAGMMDVYKSEKARLKSLLINEARKFMADHLDITVRVE